MPVLLIGMDQNGIVSRLR